MNNWRSDKKTVRKVDEQKSQWAIELCKLVGDAGIESL